MDVILIPLFNLITTLLVIYFWIVIMSVVMNWLLVFGVVNTGNQLVSTLSEFLYRMTEPVLRPVRKVLPNLGGLDISPLILLLGIHFVQQFLELLFRRLMGAA